MGSYVDHSYKMAVDSASHFDSLRVVHDFCVGWDEEAYKVTLGATLPTACCVCVELRRWRADGFRKAFARPASHPDCGCVFHDLCAGDFVRAPVCFLLV